MTETKIKESVRTIKKNNLHYILDSNGKVKKFKPWLGDMFSFLYDRIMEKSIFPRKFKGSIGKHFSILKEEYTDIREKRIVEVAVGSGFSADILPNSNSYTGIDISGGLLSRAVTRFRNNKFPDPEFYIADACDLPFTDEFFDVAICDLSLNFLGNIESLIKELKRVLKKGSLFYCSVPVPERKDPQVKIRGRLYTEAELKSLFEKDSFTFIPKPYINGALLYFEARLDA